MRPTRVAPCLTRGWANLGRVVRCLPDTTSSRDSAIRASSRTAKFETIQAPCQARGDEELCGARGRFSNFSDVQFCRYGCRRRTIRPTRVAPCVTRGWANLGRIVRSLPETTSSRDSAIRASSRTAKSKTSQAPCQARGDGLGSLRQGTRDASLGWHDVKSAGKRSGAGAKARPARLT